MLRTLLLDRRVPTNASHDDARHLIVKADIAGIGACGRGYTIAGLSGTASTKRALGKGGTALGGVPPFPKILGPMERIATSPGVPPIWYKLVLDRENVRGREFKKPYSKVQWTYLIIFESEHSHLDPKTYRKTLMQLLNLRVFSKVMLWVPSRAALYRPAKLLFVIPNLVLAYIRYISNLHVVHTLSVYFTSSPRSNINFTLILWFAMFMSTTAWISY